MARHQWYILENCFSFFEVTCGEQSTSLANTNTLYKRFFLETAVIFNLPLRESAAFRIRPLSSLHVTIQSHLSTINLLSVVSDIWKNCALADKCNCLCGYVSSKRKREYHTREHELIRCSCHASELSNASHAIKSIFSRIT